MRLRRLIALVCALALCLGGCGISGEVENHAYVLVLGVDRLEDGRLELTARVPQIGKGKAAEQDGDGGAYLTFSGVGGDYPHALEALEQATPRPMNLSHIKLIAASEALAREADFAALIARIAETPHLYTTARFVVCDGAARDFVAAQETVIGTRLSSELDAMLEHYAAQGYIPRACFADAFYLTGSVYGDPIAIRAFAQAAQDRPAASLIDPPAPVDGAVSSPMDRRFSGAALFREGRMVGTLDAEQTRLLNLIRGELRAFPFECSGRRYTLTPQGRPRRTARIEGSAMRLSLSIELSTLDDLCAEDAATLEEALEASLRAVIAECQRLEADPFGFCESAAAQFLTLADWRAIDWRALYAGAPVEVSVRIKTPNV